MRSKELKVSQLSDYYVYAPSALAKKIYLYPLSTGFFIYEPDYFIKVLTVFSSCIFQRDSAI